MTTTGVGQVYECLEFESREFVSFFRCFTPMQPPMEPTPKGVITGFLATKVRGQRTRCGALRMSV